MRWMTRVGVVVSLVLVAGAVWSYQRYEANDRAFVGMIRGTALTDANLEQQRQEIAYGYAHASTWWNTTAFYFVAGLLGVGLLELLLSLLLRKHPGAGMIDYGVASIACALLVGMASGRGVDPEWITLIAGIILLATLVRRLWVKRL